EWLIATNKDWKQRKALRALRAPPPPRGRSPKGLTTRGRRLYKKRGQTVEPVFGQIKRTRGCAGVMRRGTAACASEWKLLCATHNLLKLWRNEKASGTGRRRGRDGQRCGWGRGKRTEG
ncbi:MAG: transposase, partial [Nitrospirota bacterium]